MDPLEADWQMAVQLAGRYGIDDVVHLHRLYEVRELLLFLPEYPTEAERTALQQVMGATAVSGYMDYDRSTNTFELIMQWQEQLGRFEAGQDFTDSEA